MKRYPMYKDSGIDWLGEIPEHWEVKRLKFIVSNIIQQRNFKTDSETYVALEHIESWTGKLKQSDEEVTFESTVKCFRPNDVLFGKLRPYLAKAIICEKYGVCVGELLVIRVKENTLIPKFILFNFLSKPFINIVNSSTYGAKMPRASWEFISNLGFHIPPLSEQKTIACFIDRKLVQIDQFISNKQRFIELLKEQKSAIVNRAVTKGLNPDAPMKPSGIEWLGDIPQHWEVKRAKHVSYVFVPQRNKPELNNNNGFSWITMEDIISSSVSESTSGHFVNEIDALKAGSRLLPEGSVIASCVGNFGISSVNTVPVIINQQLQAYIPIKINPYYLRYLIGISKSYFEQIANATTLAYVNQAGFAELPITLPPTDEQLAIMSFLDKELTTIDLAIAKAEKEIELIQEYRTTLISDAVTGKIDVRELTHNS